MPVSLGLELDGAVEVEVPVEAVVVVADRGEERDHQAALAAHLAGVGEQVRVLPEDAVVLLVHADGVADGLRVAEVVGDDGVGVVDVAEAVAAQLEGVGVAGEHVLAAVEVVLPEAHRCRLGRRAPPSRRRRRGRRSGGRRSRSGAGSGPRAR